MVTPTGVRFTTTRPLLEEFAGPVLEHTSIEDLVRRAESWLRSPQVVALWLIAVLLLVLPPGIAVLAGLLVYVAWAVLSPMVVSRRLAAAFRVLEAPLVQGAAYVVVLSVLGWRGELAAVGLGLGAFIAMRWQLLPLALGPLVTSLRRPLSTLPPADQILRAFVYRAALRHGVTLPQIEQLRRRGRPRPFGGG